MQNYQGSTKVATPPGAARWRATREAPQVEPEPPAPQASTLQETHAVWLVDYLTELTKEYPAAQRWEGDLFAAIAGGTPALSPAPCPGLPAAHAKAHLHLVACEVGRLLTLYPRAVLAGLVEGLSQRPQ